MEKEQIITTIITLSIVVVTSVINYFFQKRNKVSEMLFNTRKELYSEFMRHHGMVFNPSIFADLTLTEQETHFNKMQKMGDLFSRCRLVAGQRLEKKLRDLYDLIIEVDKFNRDENENSKFMHMLLMHKRAVVGYEVESLIRRDLKIIGLVELFKKQIFYFFEIKKVDNLLKIKNYKK